MRMLLALAAAPLLLAPAAHAATVGFEVRHLGNDKTGYYTARDLVAFTADPGEANAVTVTLETSAGVTTAVTIRDPGATTWRLGEGCTATDGARDAARGRSAP